MIAPPSLSSLYLTITLDTVVEKMAVLNQQTKGLIYIVSGIVVWALFQLSFVMTGLMIVSAGGLHVYIHRFLKNGGTAPENDAENQFWINVV